MFVFTESKKVEFLKKTGKQKLLFIDSLLRRSFNAKDSQEAIEFFSAVSFKETGITLEKYKQYLKSLSQLILLENDQVGYLEGIKTLKKCYKNIHQKVSYKALINAFVKCVFENEQQNILGFEGWMNDAYSYGIITAKQKDNLIAKYSSLIETDSKTN